MVLICAMVLSGCGFTESSELMTGARKFIENGEYDKAMTNLSKVLDEDESNTEARGMYYQAMKLKKATKCNDRKDYEQEIKELQDLLNDNSGSAKVRSQAEEMLSKAQESLKNQNRATITRKENAKKSAEENKDKYKSDTFYNSGQYNKRKYNYNDDEQDNSKKNYRNSNSDVGNGQDGSIDLNKSNQGRGNSNNIANGQGTNSTVNQNGNSGNVNAGSQVNSVGTHQSQQQGTGNQ